MSIWIKVFLFLLKKGFLVGPKDDLGPEAVDMLLLQRDRLCQDVKTGAHEIDVKDLVVADDAVNALIVVSAVDWSEVYLDADK